MRKYSKILKNAECIAARIHKDVNDPMPSIFSLIKWLEEKFCLKVKISYTSSDEFNRSGVVYFDREIKSYRI